MNPTEKQINGTHYKEMAIQPSEFIVKNNIGWYEGNAIKYLCRHSKKGGKVDLEKAMHYIELAIQEYYGREEQLEKLAEQAQELGLGYE